MDRTRLALPVPDPTTLTNDAVRAAKDELKELIFTKLTELEKLSDTKLTNFKELVEEKFAGRDKALAAALKAADELSKQQNQGNTLAIDKAASATASEIKNLNEKIETLRKSVDEVNRRNWAAVGGYIVGAVGVIASIVAVIAMLLRN